MSTENAIEVKKDGLRQCQDGTWKLSLTVHPNDMLTSLMTAPMGTRYGMALVEIGDDEQPVSSQPKPPQANPSHRKPAATLSEKMQRLFGVPRFQDWMRTKSDGGWDTSVPLTNKYERTSVRVKHHCMIKSTSELDTNPEAAKRCNTLLADYEQATGRMAETR